MTIHRIISLRAQKAPNQMAIESVRGEGISHGELKRQTDAIASALRRRGIESTDRVALVLPDGPEMAITFLACTSVCACAPLNPHYKERDFAFYMDDLQPKAVIVADGSESVVETIATERKIPIWRVAGHTRGNQLICDLVDSPSETAGPVDLNGAEDVALILHTSGTTSRPKMVPLTNGNLVASARNVASTLGLRPDDRGLVVMPLFHIHGLVGSLLSSIQAGSTVICSPGFKEDEILQWARAGRATWYSAVPTMHQAILSRAREYPDETEGVRFRFIRSSSASLPPKVFADLASQWKAAVIESYGMTEAAHQMTSNPLPPARQKPGSVGCPAGPEVQILDEQGSLLPAGESGAIVIRGTNVTKGYVNNEEANQEAFADGWFRTGDQGYFDEDGYLFLTGRLKEMINRGGENIAPREIDEILLEHPAVAQATAFAIPHDTLGEDLAAAVILERGAEASEFELRQYLSGKVADFKVPSQIVFVDEIPKGPTGKLQRIGLNEKLADVLKIEYVSPTTQTETIVVKAYESVLGCGPVGVDDNFFFLGGDSLKAMRVLSRLRESECDELTVTSVFMFPTSRQLAHAIDEMVEADDDLEALVRQLSHLSPAEVERLIEEAKDGE